jgi:hypothetical protein
MRELTFVCNASEGAILGTTSDIIDYIITLLFMTFRNMIFNILA